MGDYRKIVFINQATGYLTIDIINEFVKEFDEVALITGSIRVQNDPLCDEVSVSKIVKYNRGNSFYKALSWLLGTIQIYFLLKFRYKDFEIVFFTIPPTSYLLPVSKRTFSVVIYDLYPDALLIYGLKKSSIIYRWWAGRNRSILSRAHKVFTLSENMKAGILYYSKDIDVELISNWSAFSGYTPVPKYQNEILNREGLQSNFIIQYSGNIGVTHNVETIVELAEKFISDSEIIFQIIGRGKRLDTIRELIVSKGLNNCILLPFRKDEELYESLCAADIAIVTLDDSTPDISVPSKIFNLMAAGVPVLTIASLSSAVSGVVAKYEMGKGFEKTDIQGMYDFVLKLKNDKKLKNQLSANSIKAARDFSKDNAAKYLEYYN